MFLVEYGCFLKWWYPQNIPKWSFFSRKTLWLLGTTILGNPHKKRFFPRNCNTVRKAGNKIMKYHFKVLLTYAWQIEYFFGVCRFPESFIYWFSDSRMINDHQKIWWSTWRHTNCGRWDALLWVGNTMTPGRWHVFRGGRPFPVAANC